MKYNLIYITCSSAVEAKIIGVELVNRRLAACVNIIPGMQSIYRWQGKVEEAAEVILLAKTTEAKTPELIEKVKEMHSYECPCIISVPITGGNPEFLKWIEESVAATE